MRNLGVVVLLLACACTKSNPISCKDGYCQDERYPFCDVGGEIDGNPLTCIAVDCTPNEFAACRGSDEALVCNASGDSFDANHCDNGCDPLHGGCVQTSCIANTTSCGDHVLEQCDGNGVLHTQACTLGCLDGPPHCAYLSPKYLPDICDLPATAASLSVTASIVLDSSLDTTCNGGIVAQPGSPDICVVRYGTVEIVASGAVQFVGTRAVAVVTDGPLVVAGRADVSARGTTSGPGMVGSSGVAAALGGGGGAGFATSGGAGGSDVQAGGGGMGGVAVSASTLAFFGGGYRAATNTNRQWPGGGAGGGLMLVSCRGEVQLTGTVEAGGGGGPGGGTNALNQSTAGGGGGSGGYIVLQGASIAVSGMVAANGGAGGCGRQGSAAGANGADARDTAAGPCVATSGSGGAGGSTSTSVGVGGAGTNGTPGAGGGSMGYVQTYTPASVVPTLTPSIASPAFQPNLTIPTR